MQNKDNLLVRVHLGFLISWLSFFFVSIIVKLCGVDIFTITQDIPWLISISETFSSNVWLKSILLTTMFVIQMLMIVAISTRYDNFKKLITIMVVSLIPIYLINVAIIKYNFIPSLWSVLIPLGYCCVLLPNKSVKEYGKMLLRFLLITLYSACIQEGLLYLKVNLLSCNYHSNNLFHSVLLNCEYLCFLSSLLSISIVCKIKHKEE